MPDPKPHDVTRTVRHSSNRRIKVVAPDDDENTIPELTNDPFEDAFAFDDDGAAERRRDPLRH